MFCLQVKELNSYVALKKKYAVLILFKIMSTFTFLFCWSYCLLLCFMVVVDDNEDDFSFFFTRYSSNLASNNKRVDLFDGPAEDNMEENVLLASS